MAIEINGKVYRNLQEQVKKNMEDIELLKQKPQWQVIAVDELPEEGQPGILYLVPSEDPELGNVYEEYIWVIDEDTQEGSFELIGTTSIDLSGFVTLDTAQDITAAKTFVGHTNDTCINFKYGDTSDASQTFRFRPTSDYGVELFRGSNSMLTMHTSQGLKVNAKVRPYSDNTSDLGESSYKWKDLYLGGKVETVNSTANKGWKIEYDQYNEPNFYASIDSGSTWQKVFSWEPYNIKTYTVKPVADNAYDIGKSSYRYKDLYLNGSIKQYNTDGDYWTSTVNSSGYLDIASNGTNTLQLRPALIYPTSDNAFNIGTATQRFKDLYLSGNIINKYNNMTINNDGYDIVFTVGDGKALRPSWTEHYNLGTSGYKWKDLYLAGDIKQSTWTYGERANGNLTFAKSGSDRVSIRTNDIVPNVDNTISLGTSGLAYKDLYLGGTAHFGSSDFNFGQFDANTWILKKGNSNLIFGTGANIYSQCNIQPQGNKNLGTNSSPWYNVYISNEISDGTNSVTVAQIVNGLAGDPVITASATSTYVTLTVPQNVIPEYLVFTVNIDGSPTTVKCWKKVSASGNVEYGLSENAHITVSLGNVATPSIVVDFDQADTVSSPVVTGFEWAKSTGISISYSV